MNTPERIAAYTAYVRSLDPRFFCEIDAHSRHPSRPVFWVKYRLGPYPLKIAAISEFDESPSGPGDWLRQALESVDWREMIQSAKASFSREYDARRALGIDRATSVPV